MGCGSSSLKGEKTGDIAGDGQMAPARRVQTNFSDIDFSSGRTDGRRGTTAVAPDEQHRRPTRISESGAEGRPDEDDVSDTPDLPETSNKAQAEMGGAKLEPYKSITDELSGETSIPPKAKDAAPEIQAGLHASNEEAVALTTAGTSGTNPIKATV